MAKTIILTGGIGSGKTCVSEIFSNLGIRVIDADQIAKNLTVKSNAVREKIKSVQISVILENLLGSKWALTLKGLLMTVMAC